MVLSIIQLNNNSNNVHGEKLLKLYLVKLI